MVSRVLWPCLMLAYLESITVGIFLSFMGQIPGLNRIKFIMHLTSLIKLSTCGFKNKLFQVQESNKRYNVANYVVTLSSV